MSHTKIHVFYYSLRLERVKMRDFWEEYSNKLEDDEFRRFYRMDKSTFRALMSFLNPKTRQYQGGHLQVRPHKMVAMTLFILGSKLPFWQLSGLFGLSEECFIRISRLIQIKFKCMKCIKFLDDNKWCQCYININYIKLGRKQYHVWLV